MINRILIDPSRLEPIELVAERKVRFACNDGDYIDVAVDADNPNAIQIRVYRENGKPLSLSPVASNVVRITLND